MLIEIFKAIWRSGDSSGSPDVAAGDETPPRLGCWRACLPLFECKIGLEIGGPSPVFARHGLCPVYSAAARIDNCNFSRQTVWGSIGPEGAEYRVDEECSPGEQYIAEAADLSAIASDSYDFVVSSHSLEHVANPLRAASEWMRVLNDEGALLLVLPHKDGTFDHRRPVTTLEHMIRDFEQQTTEADLTHLDEILKLHDLALDPAAGDPQAFRQRSERNLENRCLHHHVFDMRLAVDVVNHMGLQIHAVEAVLPYHIFVVAQKVKAGEQPRNERFTGAGAECLRGSPFPSDRSYQGRGVV
ncbi:MAG: methyltransferase domain-containing protein [Burkholderiales bacterium]